MALKTRSSRERHRSRRPEARLVQFEERRRIATRPLRGKEVRIGRDPSCDLIVDYANVSRQHAVVRELGDRSVVLDLGSTNGVRVNGTPIGGQPHLLTQGDVIELSKQVVLLYEEGPFGSSTPWVVTAVAMLILLAASVGLYLSMGSDGPETAPAMNPDGVQGDFFDLYRTQAPPSRHSPGHVTFSTPPTPRIQRRFSGSAKPVVCSGPRPILGGLVEEGQAGCPPGMSRPGTRGDPG